MLTAWYVVVQSVVCCQDLTSKPPSAPLYLTVCVRRPRVAGNMTWALFRGYMRKHVLERVPTPLFGRLVRCSANGRSFTRPWCYTILSIHTYHAPVSSNEQLSTLVILTLYSKYKGFWKLMRKKTHTNWFVSTCAYSKDFGSLSFDICTKPSYINIHNVRIVTASANQATYTTTYAAKLIKIESLEFLFLQSYILAVWVLEFHSCPCFSEAIMSLPCQTVNKPLNLCSKWNCTESCLQAVNL